MYDLHIHSKNSDWLKNNEEIIEEAKKKKLKFIVCTDHDKLNPEFINLANIAWIESVNWVELSTRIEEIKRNLHFTLYFSEGNTTGLEEMILNSRKWRGKKVEKQINLLQSNWFDIEYEKYLDYFWANKKSHSNLNSSHIARYIYNNPRNIELIYKLIWENLDKDQFIQRCLMKEWDLSYIGWWVQVPEYLPSLQKCVEIKEKINWIISLAHPNFKFSKKNFEEYLKLFLDQWLDAVEINSKATKEWVNLILKLQDKYWYLITFWSDCHFKWADDKHWELWDINPHLNQNTIEENMKIFRNQLKIKSVA